MDLWITPPLNRTFLNCQKRTFLNCFDTAQAQANQSIVMVPVDITGDDEAAQIDAINHNANSGVHTLLGMSPELLMRILEFIPLPELVAAARSCKCLAELIAQPYFRRNCLTFTSEEYAQIIDVQIPEIFGEAHGFKVQRFLEKQRTASQDRHLVHLMKPKNVVLLRANRRALLNYIVEFQLRGENGVQYADLDIAKPLVISSHSSDFFETTSVGPSWLHTLHSLMGMSSDDIVTFLRVRDQYADVFFKKAMREREWILINKTLLGISIAQIGGLAEDFILHRAALPLEKTSHQAI